MPKVKGGFLLDDSLEGPYPASEESLSFPDHAGIPGHQGGSLPRGAGGGVVERKATPDDISRIDVKSGNIDWSVKRILEDDIPAEHLDKLKTVDFVEGQFIQTISAATNQESQAYGTYDPREYKIKLASNADNIKVIGGGTVHHEVGHHVHLSKMDTAGAAEWAEISSTSSARISAYAHTNQGEHFAEAYRMYYQGADKRAILKRVEPRAYNFMRNRVANNKTILPAGEVNFGSWEYRYNPKKVNDE